MRMHILLPLLHILVAVSCTADCATLRQYSRDWLIPDPEPDPDLRGATRRITAKSVFIAPDFDTVKCNTGYREDARGQCVKIVRVSQSAQLDFLLQKLNSKYGAPAPKPDSAPMQIDLSVPLKLESSLEVPNKGLGEVTGPPVVSASTEFVTDSSPKTERSPVIPVSLTSSVNPVSATEALPVSPASSTEVLSSTEVSSTQTQLPTNISSTESLYTTQDTNSTTTESSSEVTESVTEVSTTSESTEGTTEVSTTEESNSDDDLPLVILTSIKDEFMELYNSTLDAPVENNTSPVLSSVSVPEVVLIEDNKPSFGTKGTGHREDLIEASNANLTAIMQTEGDENSKLGEDVGVDSFTSFPTEPTLLPGEEDLDYSSLVQLEAETDPEQSANAPEKQVDVPSLGTQVEGVLPDKPDFSLPESSTEVWILDRGPVSKPTRNSYPGIDEILNINPQPNPGQVQSHNLNPSKMVPPLVEHRPPNRLPDFPFGLDEIRNPPIPPVQHYVPFGENSNVYNIQTQPNPYYPNQPNYHLENNRNRDGYIRFPSDMNQRYYSPDKVGQNTVKFPQEGPYSDDKYKQWTEGWGDVRVPPQRAQPSMGFWSKMPFVRRFNQYNRRRQPPQYS